MGDRQWHVSKSLAFFNLRTTGNHCTVKQETDTIKFVPQRFLSQWHLGRVDFKGQVGRSMEAIQETKNSRSYSGMRGILEVIEMLGL